jgi:hypothetical protein
MAGRSIARVIGRERVKTTENGEVMRAGKGMGTVGASGVLHESVVQQTTFETRGAVVGDTEAAKVSAQVSAETAAKFSTRLPARTASGVQELLRILAMCRG